MDLVIGLDSTPRGDDALRAARALSQAEGGLSSVVVVVLTQRDLDGTGELDTASKQQAAIEKTYPRVWKRVEAIVEEEGAEGHGLEVDVVVRVAPGHLARSEALIAEAIVGVAKDFSAPRVVLGRKGRPDSVADHVLARGTVEAAPSCPDGTLVVRLNL